MEENITVNTERGNSVSQWFLLQHSTMSHFNHHPQLNLNDDNGESIRKKIKHHEDNLRFLYSQSNLLADSILDFQVSLGRYHSANAITSQNGNGTMHTEEDTVEQISKIENSAASIFCWLKANNQTASLAFAKDVVGVVATLAKVESDDLSRILSEYLGLNTMLAIVCGTNEGINALEKFDPDGMTNTDAGLHGLACSIGRMINGRFVAICLEGLRPFVGGTVANDPQKKLAIPKPRLPNGECPPGFIDYAVNMLHLDANNLSFVTPGGYGLRETLFYDLFSHLQVYKTRNDMLNARLCIGEGAVSLDGGMIKKFGGFFLGSRKEMEVKFPLISGESEVPPNYIQAEDEVRKLKWQKSKIDADIEREQKLLDYAKSQLGKAV